MSFPLVRLVAIVIGLTCLTAAPSVHACSCMRPGPVEDEAAKAVAVFSGQVVDVQPDQGEELGGAPVPRLRVTLQVIEPFKGVTGERVTVTTGQNSAMCGFVMDQGSKYLLYAHEAEGALGVNLCSRSAPLDQAADDLAALRQLDLASAPGQPPEPAAGEPSSEPSQATPAAGAAPPPSSGGCAGCTVPASQASPSGFAALLVALGLVLRRAWARRR